jgi:DNA-binding NtrC family response regulator
MEQRTGILYVDDDEPNLDSFRLILDESYPLFTAGDHHAALQVLRQHPEIGVAIVDWRMPGMNGTQLIHKMKESRPDLACILFTAYLSFELGSACARDPLIFKYVEKPMLYDSPEFRGILDGALAEHRRLSGAA